MTLFERIERIDRLGIWQAIGRPAMAYCLACYTATVLIYLYMLSPSAVEQGLGVRHILTIGASFGVLVAILSFIPTTLAIVIVRKTRLRRGFADIVAGAMIGPLVGSAFFMTIGGITFGDVSIPAWNFLRAEAVFGLVGAVAGLTYWLVVGRPKNSKAR